MKTTLWIPDNGCAVSGMTTSSEVRRSGKRTSEPFGFIKYFLNQLRWFWSRRLSGTQCL